MYCPECGRLITNGRPFCPECGASLGDPAKDLPAQKPVRVIPAVNVNPAFILSIIAAALCRTGLPGLILSIIAKKKVRSCTDAGAPLSGKLKAANILSKVAFILSIVMTVFWILYIAFVIAWCVFMVTWLISEAGNFPDYFNDLFDAVIRLF